MLDEDVIVEDWLKAFFFDVLIHCVEAAVVADFELLVALFVLVFFSGVFGFVVSDSC